MRLTDGSIVAGLLGLLAAAMFLVPAPVQAQRDSTVRCESINGKFNRCPMPWRDAVLVRQESKGACIRGQSWGTDRQGLWVDRGCRGIFSATRTSQPGYGNGHGGGMRPSTPSHSRPTPSRPSHSQPSRPHNSNNWNRSISLECGSHKQQYRMCQVDVGPRGSVRMVRQVSSSSCVRGRTWGWNRAGVWVDQGCRAQFVVDRRR